MYRDIFTNKWIIRGIATLIIVACACFLWYKYDTAADRKAAAETAELLRQWAAKKSTPDDKTEQPAAAPVENTEKLRTETTGAVVKIDTSLNETTQYVPGDVFIGPAPPTERGSKDELVSPYGFGPYPELPEGFGPITWPRRSAESELRTRVRIKLLKEGIPVKGAVMENGLVYPIIKGIRYVKWGERAGGSRYLTRSLGHPDDGDRMQVIEEEKYKRRESFTQADVPDIKLVPFEEGGIDPYTFLDLPK